jgi:hypothetical protein
VKHLALLHLRILGSDHSEYRLTIEDGQRGRRHDAERGHMLA